MTDLSYPVGKFHYDGSNGPMSESQKQKLINID